MVLIDLKTLTIPELTMEFLRRVVNELKGRRFDFCETALCVQPEGNYGNMVSACGNAEDILKYLPEITREFAAKIKPEFTRCYQLGPPFHGEDKYFTARDPLGGLSIRCFKHWDVIHSKLMYRFDAAFS